MKKKSIYLFLFLFTHIYYTYAQQIITDNTLQPNELIQNLIGTNCASASNVLSTTNGDIDGIISYGAFDAEISNFPLQSGIILSTGDVTSSGNNSIDEDLSSGSINWTTDSDILDILGIDQTLNATSIEFDFVSANNFISFKYLFASEEYQQEYPCNFKDVFAILIKRANTSDPYINIAVIPETTTEVSTNTIHPNIEGFCDAQNENYFDGYNSESINFNGQTEVLTANSAIIPGETYRIKFVIADHIDQRFDSAVFIEAEGLGSTIDLGPNQSICSDNFSINANVNNPSAVYSWFLDGNEIIGENNPALEVSQSGTYDVEVIIPVPGSNCLLEGTIDIEIVPFLVAPSIQDLFKCDPAPSDGIYDFDFQFLKNDEILALLPSTDYTISYHTTENNAINNVDPILSIYQNVEPQGTIFVRIESQFDSCLQIGSFDFEVITSSDISTQSYTLDICEIDIIDLGIEDLTQFDVVMSDSEINRVVSYYMNEFDAINNINPINDFPDFSVQPPYIVARVGLLGDSNDCFSLSYLNFNYLSPESLGADFLILDACLDPMYQEFDGTTSYNYDNVPVSFNIDEHFQYIEETLYPGSSVRTLELYGLGNPRILTLSGTPSVTLRIGISYENSNCFTEIPLIVHKNFLYNTIGNNNEFYKCDEAPNDNIVLYDLEDIATDLKNGYDIAIDFYATEEDRENQVNPLDQTELLTVVNEQTLFVQSNYEDCSFNSQVSLKINPTISISNYTFDSCGYTNPITNTTNIILEPLRENIINDLGIVGVVGFYESLEDAENQDNLIASNDYDLSNNQDLYIRVTQFFTNCYDISTLQINITNILETSDIDSVIICDQDQDLITTINLENVLDDLQNYSDDLVFTFYDSFENALESNDVILNPSNYSTTSKTIFVRVDSESEGCFTVLDYDVLVYSQPQINNTYSFINCETQPNVPSNFIFENKDSEILNNQESMEVLYFESEANAINKINPIDKTIAYQNITNPQTIYIRLENIEENSCYQIAPMQIEVRETPNYNIPTDIFECDINKNGLATTDLSEKIIEINTGSTTDLNITFHLSPLNAEVGANELPLNYTAISNPQLIYARIQNINSGCFETEAFNINTLSLPEVQYGKSLINCGNNYNFSQEWNLTDIELEILEGRQYNIEFTYFESEDDLVTNNNPILNPESYTNYSNPQTIYARVRNATTGCFDSVPFGLIINSPPQINTFETYNICENTDNLVNLSEVNQVLVNNLFNVLISYYGNETDAETNENQLNLDYLYTNSTETLFARVEYSTTKCYIIYPFQLVVNPFPIANQPNNLITCDDDFDGSAEFNLAQQNATILGNQNPNEFSISYYNTSENAINNIQSINTDYEAYNGEIIFVRLENIITGCYDITEFSTVINNPPFALITDQKICLNNLPLLVSAETNNPSDIYLWSTNATSSEIEIFETGTYSVTITNQLGCESTITFNVSESESAIIDVIETIDFSDPNNITVTVNGIGSYLYQLNDGTLQTSNVFQNVPIGYNTITIIDQNGCAQVTREVLVIDTPKHLTPNNDGNFDTWHITGAETLRGTVISIFNRYGKLLKQLKHNDLGWDGTYNGNNMPSGDYWFVADVIQNQKQFQIKGHFTLKR